RDAGGNRLVEPCYGSYRHPPRVKSCAYAVRALGRSANGSQKGRIVFAKLNEGRLKTVRHGQRPCAQLSIDKVVRLDVEDGSVKRALEVPIGPLSGGSVRCKDGGSR